MMQIAQRDRKNKNEIEMKTENGSPRAILPRTRHTWALI